MVSHDEEIAASHALLLQLMTRLINRQAQEPMESGQGWRNDAQTLAVKLFRHLVTMQDLTDGTRVAIGDDRPIEHVDFASVYVVARAALETYLTWHYIYGSSNSEQNHFRHMTWRLGGLMDRLGLVPITAEGRQTQLRTQEQVDELLPDLSAHPLLLRLTVKQQKKVLKGDLKAAMGTSDMAIAAGFHGGYFRNIYSHLCGFSHSSFISAMQVGQATKIEEQYELARPLIANALVIMGHFALSFTKLFPSALSVLDASPVAKASAERWAFRAEDMEHVYGHSGSVEPKGET